MLSLLDKGKEIEREKREREKGEKCFCFFVPKKREHPCSSSSLKKQKDALLFWNQKTVGRSLDLPIAFLGERNIAGEIVFFGGEKWRENLKLRPQKSNLGERNLRFLSPRFDEFLRTKQKKR